MSHFKDIRLWLLCLLTVIGTSVFGVAVHGALADPQGSVGPAVPLSVVSPLVTPSSPLGE